MGCHQTKQRKQHIENLSLSMTYSQPNQTKYGLDIHIGHNNLQCPECVDTLIKNKQIMIESGFVNLEGFTQKINFSKKQVLFEHLQQIF